MLNSNKLRKIVLVVVDLLLFYAGLIVALTIRYAEFPPIKLIEIHFLPFTVINIAWIVIFYISGFYDNVGKKATNVINILKAMAISGLSAVFILYLFPSFGIAPKTNLFGTIIFSSVFIWLWRKFFFGLLSRGFKTEIFFFGEEIKEIKKFEQFVSQRPEIGYRCANNYADADIIIVPEQIKRKGSMVTQLYQMTLEGKTIISFDKFYESLTGKIPTSLIDESWFLENLMEIDKLVFERVKRVIDLIMVIIFAIPFLFLIPFVSLLIKLTSRGTIFYKQKRVGKNGRIFEIVKFRSMIMEAEKNKTGWIKPNEKDNRVTFIGSVFRKTRIDELPQIWNVLKGEMSFVGPRPERPEFVQELIKEVPHYSMRHLVKPGLTGWGQINFGGASAKDAPRKLQYDLFYIKNRTLLLDIIILLKTIMAILSRQGK